MTNTPVKSPKAGRPTRTPVSQRNVLTVKNKEPGYQYRIVNDSGDRIQTFLDGGYEIVEAKDVQVGDKRITGSAPEGTLAQVNVGSGQKAYVMRISDEFYKEDQDAKEARIKQLENSMLQKAREDGLEGFIKNTRS